MDKNIAHKYKAKNPVDTVANITDILNFLEIETKITELANGEDTYSCYVEGFYKNKPIGISNGKGKTREFALASGFAEFMESISNDYLKVCTYYCVDKNLKRKTKENLGFELHHNEKLYSLKECMQQKLFKDLFNIYGNILMLSYFEDNKILNESIPCLPYKNIFNEEINYMPPFIVNLITMGSNGMCAGNSYEEAMIEGISELFERLAVREVILTDVPCPNIPLTILEDYPELNNIVKNLEKKNFKFQLKDFSCGGKYPVVGLVLTDLSTGKFLVNAGSAPIFHIAVERCFTEIFQNKEANNIKKHLIYNFAKIVNEHPWDNLISIVNNWIGIYPEKIIFNDNNKYHIKQFIFDKKENLSISYLYNVMLEFIKKNNFDCWVRDASYYNFNAYKIVFTKIPKDLYLADVDNFNTIIENQTSKNGLKEFRDSIFYSNLNYDKLLDISNNFINDSMTKTNLTFTLFRDKISINDKCLDKEAFAIFLFMIFFMNKEYNKAYNLLPLLNINSFIDKKLNDLLACSVLIVKLLNDNKCVSEQELINQCLNISALKREDIINLIKSPRSFFKYIFNVDLYTENFENFYIDFYYHLHQKEKILSEGFN